jgi:hypothetical protein
MRTAMYRTIGRGEEASDYPARRPPLERRTG